MPVSEQTPVNSYTGNGVTTVFAYTFKIIAAADIEVTVDGVVKTLTTDYSVSGVGADGGGNVTFISAPANGTTVVIQRAMAYERATDYQENGDLPAQTLDDDLDRGVMLLQQLKATLTRSIKLPAGETTEQVIAEPAAARALKLLGFDAGGDVTVYGAADVDLATVSAYMLTLLDDATAADARATLGAWGGASADIASATTLDLTAATGNIVRITGTTATSAVTLNNGQYVICYAVGAWPLTHHATDLPLPGSTNYTCVAGDMLCFSKDGNGTKHIEIYKADGTPVVATFAGATSIGGTLAVTGDISPSQITSNQNDYNPTGLSTASVLRLNTDASRDITGLQGGADGRIVAIHNVGSFNIVLKDESASSTAAYRFALSADVTLAADQSATLQYDATSSRWRVLAGPSSGSGSVIVQVVEATPYTTYSSTATTVPYDDTIPQNTEGAQWNTVTITPTNASNRLLIEASIDVMDASAATMAVAALFQDSTANALAVAHSMTGAYGQLRVVHEMTAGTTSPTTFKLRAGPVTSGTLYINGSGARRFGGVAAVRIRVKEIKV